MTRSERKHRIDRVISILEDQQTACTLFSSNIERTKEVLRAMREEESVFNIQRQAESPSSVPVQYDT